MYRKLLQILTLVLFVTNHSFAQNSSDGSAILQKNESGEYIYEKIVTIEKVSKDELYDRAKKWIIATLKTTQEALFFDDNHKESIVANTSVRLKDAYSLTSQRVEFKLSVSFKDNKARMQATDFVYRGLYPGNLYQKSLHDLKPFSKRVKSSIYEDFDQQYINLVKDLTTALEGGKGDNW